MRSSLRRVYTGFAFFVMTVCIAVSGYLLTGAGFLDSLYMVVITIFSVGYEETVAIDTPALKLFTIFVILAGCSSLLYVVGGFIQMATEGEINRALGARRMTRGIDSLRNHTIICGFGRMGQMIAKELALVGYPFVVIEKNEERIAEAEDRNFLLIAGDATEEEHLEAAQIKKAKTLAIVLSNDAANVFITLSARNMNPDLMIMARGEVIETEAKLMQAGANQVVLPTAIGGMRMAQMIARPAASHLLSNVEHADALRNDLEQLGVEVSDIPIPAGSRLVRKSIEELEIMGDGAYLVVAVRRADGTLHRKPEATFTLEANDAVIVIGHGDAALQFTTKKTPAREIFRRGKRALRRK